MTRPSARAALAVLAAVVLASSCGGDGTESTVLVADARAPAAMVPLPDGGLLYGERLTGRIRRVEADGRVERTPVAQVDVSTAGQRGLLGLAVDREGRVFAAWTDPARRLQVAQVAPGPVRSVWILPRTARLANGGRLAFARDGRLLLGIGDLQQPDRIDDPAQPNGKLLRLDPDAGPDQVPEMVSGGWNNPFAFTVTAAGAVWVADNSPGDGPERLRRGDRAGPVTALPEDSAPSGLAATSDTELLVCGFVSGDLLRYRVRGDRAVAAGRVVDDCRLGVVVLADGRVAYATADAIRVLDAADNS